MSEFLFSDRHIVHYCRHVWNLHVVCFTISRKNLSCLCARGHVRLHVLASHLNNPNATSRTDWKRQGKWPIREVIATILHATAIYNNVGTDQYAVHNMPATAA